MQKAKRLLKTVCKDRAATQKIHSSKPVKLWLATGPTNHESLLRNVKS